MNTELTIAALLHDIGKFWQRTKGDKPYSCALQDYAKTYEHALWSSQFVEDQMGKGDIANWVLWHHKPDSRGSMLISLADWLISSERRADNTIDRVRPEESCMHSILARVYPKEKTATHSESELRAYQNSPHLLPLTEHGVFGDAFFPAQALNNSAEDYKKMWGAFEEDVKRISPASAPVESWLALMKRHASRVPAATNNYYQDNIPDVSLYDHSRLVAGVTECLHTYGISEEKAASLRRVVQSHGFKSDDNVPELNEPIIKLACVNLSGIQPFLYNVATSGATRALKGRSFALQLVADAISRHILDRAGVTRCSEIYNGGGKFYLFLPMGTDIAALSDELDNKMFSAFQGGITAHIGAIDLSINDFLSSGKYELACNFEQAWRRASEAANAEKHRKYTRLAKQKYADVFGIQNLKDSNEQDSAPSDTFEVSDEDKITAENKVYQDLGADLRRAEYILVKGAAQKSAENPDDAFTKFIASLGMQYIVPKNDDEMRRYKSDTGVREVILLNHFDLGQLQDLLPDRHNTAISYRFIAKNHPKRSDHETCTFEDLAKNSTGIKKLAIFRADVDNLGQLFARGIPVASPSRVATLSANLAEFFEGYLTHLITNTEKYADSIDIIYAGGDDLFVVGAWDAVIDFALDIQKAFKRYASDNPYVTLSGGITIIDPHLPLRYAADLAAEAEEEAKEYKRKEKGVEREKNALCLMEECFGFEEIQPFLEFKDKVRSLMQDDPKLSAGYLHKLMEISDAYQNELRIKREGNKDADLDKLKAEARWQRWRWMLVYALRDFEKNNKDRKEEIQAVQNMILNDKLPIEDRMHVPLRWVEWLTRKENG